MDLLSSGVPTLDDLLGGGIPAGSTVLLVGEAGGGKTTLALQMAFHAAGEGHAACFVTTTSESSQRLLSQTRSFDFYDEDRVGDGVFLVSIYPLIREGLDAVQEALEKEVREHDAELLVLDGLMTLYDLHPDPRELRIFIYELAATLTARGCTLVITSSRTDSEGRYQYSEFTMADVLVRLVHPVEETQTRRSLQVVKVRGRSPVLGVHTMRLDQRGVAVFPRFEALDPDGEIEPPEGRVSLGIDELDRMMDGGAPAGSVTGVAGSTGTGKTLLALQFLVVGAGAGERGCFWSFRETRAELVAKARSFGIDLESLLDEGTLVIEHRSPVDLRIDEAVAALRDSLDRTGCRRLVVDGIEALVDPIPESTRRRALTAVLSAIVRTRGITSVVTMQVPQLVGPELDLDRTPMASLAENLMLLRYVEFRGELHRILSILKMRDSDYDRTIRRYSITGSGLEVEAPGETDEGLLAGVAELRSEARVKRQEEE